MKNLSSFLILNILSKTVTQHINTVQKPRKDGKLLKAATALSTWILFGF